MDSARLNQIRKSGEDIIDSNAKRMTECIEPFPESERKSQWLTWIEDGKKENLRRWKEFTTL
jgi:hypothetical protein